LTLLNRPKGDLKQQEVTPAEVEQTKITGDVTFTFHGRGNGHGVGLSQWGAYGMATLGYDYEAILKHYYQGIQLTKLY
jgi:SpoIID/LytB domain protein